MAEFGTWLLIIPQWRLVADDPPSGDNRGAAGQKPPVAKGRIWRPVVKEGIMTPPHRRGRTTSLDPVAGNGLIDRRALLGKGIAVARLRGAIYRGLTLVQTTDLTNLTRPNLQQCVIPGRQV